MWRCCCHFRNSVSQEFVSPSQQFHLFFCCPSSYSPPLDGSSGGWEASMVLRIFFNYIHTKALVVTTQAARTSGLLPIGSTQNKESGWELGKYLCTGTVLKRAFPLQHCDSLVSRTYLAYNQPSSSSTSASLSFFRKSFCTWPRLVK